MDPELRLSGADLSTFVSSLAEDDQFIYEPDQISYADLRDLVLTLEGRAGGSGFSIERLEAQRRATAEKRQQQMRSSHAAQASANVADGAKAAAAAE